MVLKKLLVNKLVKYKKSTLNKGQFFSDQYLLKNQISFEELEEEIRIKEETEERIMEAKQEVSKQQSKRKKKINFFMSLFSVFVVICILVFQLSTSEVEPIKNIIKSGLFNWQFIIVILFLFCLIMFLETIRPAILLKMKTKKFHMALCYKDLAIGRYWDAATPMSTGEAFQIFYFNKHGLSSELSISVPIARYVIFQITLLMFNIFVITYSSKHFPDSSLVSVASYIGFGINAFLLLGVWVLSVSKKLGKILVAKLLKLLTKMKIVKNYEKVYDKVMDTVNGFQATMRMYTKNIFLFLVLVVINLFQFIVTYSIPYFIYLLLGGVPSANMWVTILVYAALIDLASSFTPLPGGSGMNEVSFTLVFTSIFPNGTVFWGLLLWRFMNHYIYLLQGIFVMIYDGLVGNRKLEWEKKKWQLEQESIKFKEEQIKNYNKRKSKGKIKL